MTERSPAQRLAAERRRGHFSNSEREIAHALRASRERIAETAGEVRTCAHCADESPGPSGPWAGGYCCTGRTELLFDEAEIAALAAAGTRPRHLRRRPTHPTGCRFLSDRGCVLPPRHRPNQCLRYLCPELQRELHARGVLDRIEQACEENERLFRSFDERRKERLEGAFCERLLRLRP